MLQLTFTGTIGADAVTRQAGDGNVTAFRVAVNTGFGDRKVTYWIGCNMWGKRGDSLAPYLLKGGKVAVSGEFSTREYDGKTQLEVRVNEVDLMGGNERRSDTGNGSRTTARAGGGGPAMAEMGDDLDDSVPF